MSETDTVISVRFDQRINKIIREFADSRGETLSTVIRRLVLRELAEHSYLSDKEKKALGTGGEQQ